jgi:hypothetical protein
MPINLEIQKGLGNNGAMINFPVANITADLIIRQNKFPTNFGQQSRQWFLNQLPKNLRWYAFRGRYPR